MQDCNVLCKRILLGGLYHHCLIVLHNDFQKMHFQVWQFCNFNLSCYRPSQPIRTNSGQTMRTTTIHRPNSTITITKPIGSNRQIQNSRPEVLLQMACSTPVLGFCRKNLLSTSCATCHFTKLLCPKKRCLSFCPAENLHLYLKVQPFGKRETHQL